MLHTFEEIVTLRATRSRFRRNNKHHSLNDSLSTAAYSFECFVQFIILSVTTLLCALFEQYLAWLALFSGFLFHLFWQTLRLLHVQRYLPGGVSAVALLPVCIVLLVLAIGQFSYHWLLLVAAAAAGLLFLLLLRLLLQLITPLFDHWLSQFADRP